MSLDLKTMLDSVKYNGGFVNGFTGTSPSKDSNGGAMAGISSGNQNDSISQGVKSIAQMIAKARAGSGTSA